MRREGIRNTACVEFVKWFVDTGGMMPASRVFLLVFSCVSFACGSPNWPFRICSNLHLGSARYLCAEEVSFTRDVMAVLSKSGCNMGSCHGNAQGKGGFRLSLRGQDPEFDYHWLTRDSNGRRVDLLVPESSLCLQKPLGQVSHQGGIRFRLDSPEYSILERWLVQGALGPQYDEPQLVDLQVTPASRFLVSPDDSCQIVAQATFADGSQRDVTRFATYELSNLLADVSADGFVTTAGFGETTIMVRYLNRQAPVRIAFIPSRESFVWSDPPAENYIDRLIHGKLMRLRINPSELASDTVFLRRAYLDAIGILPTAEEARQFVADRTLDKRSRLIDFLLARPEFADHWALKWSDVLRNEEKVLDSKGVQVFYDWIHERMSDGTGIDQFVRKLIRATGSTYENPPANFWRANRDPATRAEATARLFLGTRLQCAKCHNHPFDRWTQDDYYSWAAVFARLDYEVVKNERKDGLDKNEFVGEQIVQIAQSGGMQDPRTGEFARPKLLGADFLSPGSHHDLLTPAAVWLADSSNVRFAQVQANFIWYHLMGRGLVVPIDDFRATNPASNPLLLEALADDLVASKFDLRRLVRRIMTSRTYQLSSIPTETNAGDEANFSRAVIMRLPAEKLLDSQSQVIGNPSEFGGYSRGLRAGQLPGVRKLRLRDQPPAPGDRFLKAFGKPDRILACDCERSNETTLGQAFMLIGGDLNERLAQADNRLAKLCASGIQDADLINEIYWVVLSRPPNDVELESALSLLQVGEGWLDSPRRRAWARLFAAAGLSDAPDDRLARLQDLCWALLNSKEFVFRH